MRLDVYLKVSRLVKRRPLANRLCDDGRVLLNGVPVKAGHAVHIGDELEIRGDRTIRRVRVVSVPTGQQTKAQATGLFLLLSETPADPLATGPGADPDDEGAEDDED